WIYPQATPVLGRAVALLAIVPVLRLIRPSLDRVLAAALYVFGVLFVVDAVRSVLATAPLFEHMLFLAEMLVASLVMLGVLTAAGRADPAAGADVMAAAARRLVGRLLLAAFAGAFVLAGVGYVELGRLIGGGALGSSYYGLAILAAVQVARGLAGVLLWSRRVLAAQWGWGAIRISLGDVVVFALTIWLAFFVAGALRLLLAEDVFPR